MVCVDQIVWDEQKQKWVDLNEPEEEVGQLGHNQTRHNPV